MSGLREDIPVHPAKRTSFRCFVTKHDLHLVFMDHLVGEIREPLGIASRVQNTRIREIVERDGEDENAMFVPVAGVSGAKDQFDVRWSESWRAAEDRRPKAPIGAGDSLLYDVERYFRQLGLHGVAILGLPTVPMQGAYSSHSVS